MDRRSLFEQRVEEAIVFGLESPNVEFKEAQPFDVLKYKIARTALGMANNRDGGLIIIGLSSRKDATHYNGVDRETADTYDYDRVYEFVNGFATPAIEFQMLKIDVRGATYVAIQVPPLGRSPTICRKPTPPTVTRPGEKMAEGDIFVRTRDRIGTSPAKNAAMIEDLLQAVAARRVAEALSLLEAAPRTQRRDTPSQYDREIGDLADYF